MPDQNPPASFENDRLVVEQQLGRPPAGFREVMSRTADGAPAIIRVASVVDGVPFPTLYWLSHPELGRLVYEYESNGVTQRIQDCIDQNPEHQQRLQQDNLDYIRHRADFFDAEASDQLRRLGIEEGFQKKGIGGNSNFKRVRCLHAYLAAHVVTPNLVGELLESICGLDDPLVVALGQLS